MKCIKLPQVMSHESAVRLGLKKTSLKMKNKSGGGGDRKK